VSSQLSVAQVLANLEEQMRFHRERETEHAAQEAFHRDKRAHHAAEYETVARHYEAFKASASAAAEIAARSSVPAPPPPEPPAPLKPQLPSRLVARAVYQMPADATFTPSVIASEVNKRYSRELRKPIDSRLASTALRRLMAQGQIRLAQKGTAHREAVYARG
jgi:hypothetical protein